MRFENRGLKIEDRKRAGREIRTLCAMRYALCRLRSLGAKIFLEFIPVNNQLYVPNGARGTEGVVCPILYTC